MAAERDAIGLAAALACACVDPSRPAPIVERLVDLDVPRVVRDAAGVVDGDAPAATRYPSGLRVRGPLFAFARDPAVVTFGIAGDAVHHLTGRLADDAGRRELRHDDVVIAAAGWHLPPVAAVAVGGATLVCFNTLTGAHTDRAAGEAPDPTLGMALTCRLREASGAWQAPVTARVTTPGAWIQRVQPRFDGTFRVTYWGDSGYLVGPRRDGDGVYEVIFAAGALSSPTLVLPATDPTGAVSVTTVP